MALFCVLQNHGLQLQLVNDAVNDGYLWDDHMGVWLQNQSQHQQKSACVSVSVCSISS